jgi:protein-L-isoaspartate(D-aspartate) O-methyltransferase
MAARAAKTLAELDIDNAIVVQGPLPAGWAAQSPYGVILIKGAVSEVPPAIHQQLADGGRLVTVLQPGDRQGRGILMQRHGAVVASRALLDTEMPVLPEFAREPGFVF